MSGDGLFKKVSYIKIDVLPLVGIGDRAVFAAGAERGNNAFSIAFAFYDEIETEVTSVSLIVEQSLETLRD